MLMPSPERIKFEQLNDIVDYTSKGMVPKTDNFKKVMIKLREPDTMPRNPDTEEVYISSDILPDDPNARELAAQILERVHENRMKNRRNMLIAAGIIGTAIIGGHVFMIVRHSKKETDDLRIPQTIECETLSINCEQM